MDYSLLGSFAHGISQARTLGFGSHSFLQRIFPTQESNPGLLHCSQVLDYCIFQGTVLYDTHLPVFLPGEFHGQRSLAGYSPWGHKELDTTEQLTLFTSTFFLLGLLPWLSRKEYACNAGDTGDLGSIPGWGRCPGEGNGYPLQHSCLENSMDREAWWATVHGVAMS